MGGIEHCVVWLLGGHVDLLAWMALASQAMAAVVRAAGVCCLGRHTWCLWVGVGVEVGGGGGTT
mgnify:CR=1 FL=1